MLLSPLHSSTERSCALHQLTSLDLRTTHLVAAVTGHVCADLGIRRPNASVLGEMFVRVRERLADLGEAVPPDEVAAVVSLTIYLTWQTEADAPDSRALSRLKERVEEALHA